MSDDRRELRRQMQEAGEKLARPVLEGAELGVLSPEDEEILDRVWKDARRDVDRSTAAADDPRPESL